MTVLNHLLDIYRNAAASERQKGTYFEELIVCYVFNGKAALDCVMERQCLKTDKDSSIVNDANDWAIETMGNPKYPLEELFQRVVTVSRETQRIVSELLRLDF